MKKPHWLFGLSLRKLPFFLALRRETSSAAKSKGKQLFSQATLALGIENPYQLTTLNVMVGFFLLFDVTMDISHGKFISGKFGHTHHVNFPR